VLDILLQDARDTNAAKRFFERLHWNLEFMPEKIVTDQLGSYKTVWNEIPALEAVEHVFVKSEATMPDSDSAREVRFGIKKVHFMVKKLG
jgi:putative transposase